MLHVQPKVRLLWATTEINKQIQKMRKAVKGLTKDEILRHLYASFSITMDRRTAYDVLRIIPTATAESLRYVQLKGTLHQECEFIEPENFTEEQWKLWYMTSQVSTDHYGALLASGVPVETASLVLPNSLKTDLIVTGNMQEWCEWLQIEALSRVAPQILAALKQRAPKLFGDMELGKGGLK